MTAAAPTPKISYITEPYNETPKAEDEVQAKGQTVDDGYASSDPNPYKGLVAGGSAKAESLNQGTLGDMMESLADTPERKPGYQARIQELLGNLLVGDVRSHPASDTIGDCPVVPDFKKDILYNKCFENMSLKPIIKRYAGLEKVLIQMLKVAKDSVKPGKMASMNPSEIRSMRQYAEKLEDTLFYCRQQLLDARQYYRAQLELSKDDSLTIIVEPIIIDP